MIKFRARNDNGVEELHELRALMDKDGWIILPPDVCFREKDFKVALVKINNTVYYESSIEFWEEYNKAKTWSILSDTVKSKK